MRTQTAYWLPTKPWRAVALLFALLAALIALPGCQEARPPLVAVPIPDTTAYETSVQTAVAKARADLERSLQSKVGNVELAGAYGNLAMTYHAQDLTDAAEIAYKDARLLAPQDKRWPYLLGHLYNDTARQVPAIECFEATLAIDGSDPPALLSLGEVSLQHGDLDRAEQVFGKLAENKAARAVALAGLGKVALAKRDYKVAAERLVEALQLWPTASKLRYPLAMAYRAMGDRAKAEEALQGYSAKGQEPMLADPLAEALGAKAASSHALLRRGQRFGQVGRFDLAAAAFQAAADANPKSAEILANLGISLANLGQLEKAQEVLVNSLHIDAANAPAQLSLAVVYDRLGLDEKAMAHYRLALQQDPKNVQALVYLADAKMRAGLADEAAPLYRDALALDGSARIRLSLSFAWIRAGRYSDAKRLLQAGLAEDSGNHSMANALARLLASAPDPAVRDGTQALAMAKPLFEATKSPEVGQTFAMAMAETGDFEQALKLQQETMIAYDRMGATESKPFLARNLALFQQSKPAREPWPQDASVFHPRSPAVAKP